MIQKRACAERGLVRTASQPFSVNYGYCPPRLVTLEFRGRPQNGLGGRFRAPPRYTENLHFTSEFLNFAKTE